jgi:hypothetical protein
LNIDTELREVAELVRGRASGSIEVAAARPGLVAMVGRPTADKASRGLKEGTKSIEVDELAVARQTIEELEVELTDVKTASAPAASLFRRGRAIPDPAPPRTNGEPWR